MAQIISITSEGLQQQIRRLLPSQQGFGEDLQASNVVLPIIDLTPSAEGSQLRQDLAAAVNFIDASAFDCNNATITAANTAGFWRVIGAATADPSTGSGGNNDINLTDGLSSKVVWSFRTGTGSDTQTAVSFDFIVWLDTGDSLTMTTNSAARMRGSVRQIADKYGNIQNPTGFTFE
jgi:hypothetical protein